MLDLRRAFAHAVTDKGVATLSTDALTILEIDIGIDVVLFTGAGHELALDSAHIELGTALLEPGNGFFTIELVLPQVIAGKDEAAQAHADDGPT